MVQFDPPLSSTVAVAVSPTFIPGSLLRLYATLSRDEHASLRCDGTTLQVWCDFGTGEWSETSFAEEELVGNVQDDAGTAVDLSLAGDSVAGAPGDTVTLVATFSLPQLVGLTVQFTYRMLHSSGLVSWLGSMGTNGSITVEPKRDAGLLAEDWGKSADGSFLWSASTARGPVVVAKLGEDADWKGWAIGKEGPSSFTAVSSAVTDRVVLALLATARPGAYVAYAPTLYHTTGNATLSLTDSGEVLFHPGDGESVLHVSISTGTWMNAISDKTTTLDVRSPYFLGVSVKQSASVRRIHFLPVYGSKTSMTLTSVDLKPLASPWDNALALVDAASHATKFVAASSFNDAHIAVGPAGGEMLVLSGHILRDKENECSVACLPRGAGRVTSVPMGTGCATHSKGTTLSSEDATSESATSEEWFKSNAAVEGTREGHPSSIIGAEILLLLLHVLWFFWGLTSAAMSLSLSPPPKVDERPPVHSESQIHAGAQSEVGAPRIAFEVTGGFAIVLKGEISKLAFSVEGSPLESNPKDIGGVWLLEGDAGDDPQLLKVTLHE